MGGLIFLRLGVSERVRWGTRAHGSRPCGSEAAREEREGRAIGTGGRQPHADARSPLDDACGQLVACGQGAVTLLEIESSDGRVLKGRELGAANWRGKVWETVND